MSQSASGPLSTWQAIDDEIFDCAALPLRRSSRGAIDHQCLEATDQYLFSGLQEDEQFLFMGLTRLDALDFSGLTDQL